MQLASTTTSNYQLTFTPGYDVFKRVPIPNATKDCVVVYCTQFAPFTTPYSYGPPAVYRGLEGGNVTLYDDGQALKPWTPGCPASNRITVDSSRYTKDVTDVIATLSDNVPNAALALEVNTPQLGPDPLVGKTKQS
jgi:hypothetical protein